VRGDVARARIAQHGHHQRGKLGFQLRVAQRVFQRADGVVYPHMHAAAVRQHGGHVGGGFVNAVVHRGLHLVAQGHHGGAGHHLV
jgi:hypothetical protein